MRKFKPGDRVQWVEGQDTKHGKVRETSAHAKQLEMEAIQKARPELRRENATAKQSSSIIRIEDSDSGRLVRKQESEVHSRD